MKLMLSLSTKMDHSQELSTARMLVQAEAPEAQRARVLSVFILSTMSAAPLGALLLGTLVDVTSVLTGFVPGVIASLLIFVIGVKATDLWAPRRSVSADRG